LATELSASETVVFFGSWMITDTGDISTVENTGTFLLWYDKLTPLRMTVFDGGFKLPDLTSHLQDPSKH
jgi:hypothetical protein